jgi:hypothetical protein
VGVIENLAKRSAESKINDFVDYVRLGWNNYSFIFYIGGVSAILGSLFGTAGWLSVIATLIFFYYAGKFRKHLDAEKAKKTWKN